VIEQIMIKAIEVGLMAVLFVGLLVHVLRDTAKREAKYQRIIEQLQDCLSIVADIHNDVQDIKKKIKTTNKRSKPQ